ncbi:heat-shock protein HtpX, partial [bacterium]|nr:heat-shock protein HtpX [bacterium]
SIFSGPLSALVDTSLESLLEIEAFLEKCYLENIDPGPAPQPPKAPDSYITLLPGKERKRQVQLDWWDRFQTADGFLPATVRLLVASSVVFGAVYLSF